MRETGSVNATDSANAAGERTVKSAERVLDLLEIIGRHAKGITFRALLEEMQIPKSSLHALLEVMRSREYIDRPPDARVYLLGIKTWESSQAYLRQHEVIREARRVMERISTATGETVQLARLDRTENVYLAKADGTHPLRLQSEVGGRLEAHATGLGKVLLAHLHDAELRLRYSGVALRRMTANTITDWSRLVNELALIRARGFGIDNEEYTPGLFCIAVPVRDNFDAASLAMSISIPAFRANLGTLSEALALLAGGSIEISTRAGATRGDESVAALSDRANAERALAALAASGRYPLSFELGVVKTRA